MRGRVAAVCLHISSLARHSGARRGVRPTAPLLHGFSTRNESFQPLARVFPRSSCKGLESGVRRIHAWSSNPILLIRKAIVTGRQHSSLSNVNLVPWRHPDSSHHGAWCSSLTPLSQRWPCPLRVSLIRVYRVLRARDATRRL